MIAKRTDPHNQIFLRGHDDDVSAATMSRSAKLAASGQVGDHADVVVWDLEKQQLLYRFEEHDHGVPALAFSWDEVRHQECDTCLVFNIVSYHVCCEKGQVAFSQRLLLSVGRHPDTSIIFWDLATCVNYLFCISIR